MVKRICLAITLSALVLSGTALAGEDARKLCRKMIEAHGGLERWSSAPTVRFVDQWYQPDGSPSLNTKVTVEQGRRRSYIDMLGMDARATWDGEKVWAENWQVPMPPRFLAGLNYYFLNLPWLTMDPGVNLDMEGKRRLWDDPTEYHAVRMTFDPGIGDTPKDYYVLYIHPETHMLKGCEYIVTYTSLLPAGVESTSPHILVFSNYATVDGLKVAKRFVIYEPDKTIYASCDVREWSFSDPFDTSRMEMSEGAVIDQSTP